MSAQIPESDNARPVLVLIDAEVLAFYEASPPKFIKDGDARYMDENISTNALIVPATFSSETCHAAPSSAA